MVLLAVIFTRSRFYLPKQILDVIMVRRYTASLKPSRFSIVFHRFTLAFVSKGQVRIRVYRMRYFTVSEENKAVHIVTPEAHVGGQELYWWSLNHLSRRSEAKKHKNPKKSKV